MNVFIAGTDTEVGKTTVTCGLLKALLLRGRRAVGMKPVAAGPMPNGANPDAAALRYHSSDDPPYRWVNPYSFDAPTAPSIAAAMEGREFDWPLVENAYTNLMDHAEVVLVEGIGGWRVPLSAHVMASEIPKRFNLPVILVAGIKLGAINHTLLTADAIVADGCTLLGWIANVTAPAYRYTEATIAELKRCITAPCLGEIPWVEANGTVDVTDYLTLAAAVVDDRSSIANS